MQLAVASCKRMVSNVRLATAAKPAPNSQQTVGDYHVIFTVFSRPLFLFSLFLIAGIKLYKFGEDIDDKLPRIDDKPSKDFSVNFRFYGKLETRLYVRGYDWYGR